MKVVVVGSGIAGLAGALGARDAGAEVTVVAPSFGGTGLAGGAWDIAPLPAGAEAMAAPFPSIEDAVIEVARKLPGHPYARFAGDPVEHVVAAHERLLPALRLYRPLDLRGPGYAVPTEVGIVRRVATAQNTVLPFDCESDDVIALANLVGYRSFDAAFLSRAFAEQAEEAGAALHIASIDLEFFRRRSDALLRSHEVAAIPERDDGRRRLSTTLVRAVAGLGFDAVILPPLLGVQDDDVPSRVSEEAGVRVGELIAPLSGPQGLRLERAISTALCDEECEHVRRRVEGLNQTSEGFVLELDDGEELDADAVVLATGTLIGGGLDTNGDQARPSLVDLAMSDTGVKYESGFRALQREPAGTAVEGLFIAGAILDGVEPDDGTGFGVAATTGYQAGLAAAG